MFFVIEFILLFIKEVGKKSCVFIFFLLGFVKDWVWEFVKVYVFFCDFVYYEFISYL